MTSTGWLQRGPYLSLLLLLAKPLGAYMARAYHGERTFLDPRIGTLERLLCRAAGVHASKEIDRKTCGLAARRLALTFS
jgi:K+-transporting ATPase ATPase A chain